MRLGLSIFFFYVAAMRTLSFFDRVYRLVACIPPGSVMTYGQIADLLGGVYSARVVGFAMRAAPAAARLPCHRVVNRLGEMAGGHVFGGTDRQRRMLEEEGVPFGKDGRIDLAACRYIPGEEWNDADPME